jgi:hypothetical protein
MGDYEGIARRAWRRTVWIAIGGFVVGAIVGVFLANGEPALRRLLTVVGLGLSIGGLSGAISLFTIASRLAPSMQWPVRGLDKAGRRTVRRAVYSGLPIEPADSDFAHRAADWARGAAVTLPVNLGQFLLLYLGIGGAQLPNIINDDPWASDFARIFLGALVLVGVGLSTSFVRNIRGARRYVAAASVE